MDQYTAFDQLIKAAQKGDLNQVAALYRHDFLHKLDENDFTAFHHACNMGYTDITKFFIEKNVDLEFQSPYNGWRGLHLAVGNGFAETGKLLIENGADKEAKTSKGLTPLHCAAIANRYEAVKMLLMKEVNLNSKNNKNETAMQMALENECDECIDLFTKWTKYHLVYNLVRNKDLCGFKKLYIKEKILVKEGQTGLTVLDIAVETKTYECLEWMFVEDLNEETVLEGLKGTLNRLGIDVDRARNQFRLYRSIMFEKKDEFRESATVTNTNEMCILSGETFLEICVRHNREIFVDCILEQCLSVDEKWTRAMTIADERGLVRIGEKIRSRKSFVENRVKAGYNRLHIAVQDKNVRVMKHILEQNMIDPNICGGMLGPPLCLALSLGHMECVKTLLQCNVDVNMTNTFNQTPLHIAIESRMKEDSLLFSNQTDCVDHKDCKGFTPLHLAVIDNNEPLCDILVGRGADVFMSVQIHETNHLGNVLMSSMTRICEVETPLTLCLKMHRTIMRSMMDRIDEERCNMIYADGDSLLHLSTKLLVPSVSATLIAKGCNVNCLNANGNTPLHAAFLESTENSWEMEGFFETIEVLINNGADINAENMNGMTAFKCALETNSRKAMNVVLCGCTEVKVNAEDLFHLYERQWPDVMKTILDLQDVEFKENVLIKYVEESPLELIEFVIELSEESMISGIAEKCLSLAGMMGREEIFDRFLEYEINHPKFLQNGETLLTHLILFAEEKYCMKLCKSNSGEKLFDMKNEKSETALHTAARRDYLKVFEYLVLECENIEEEENGVTAIEIVLERMMSRQDNPNLNKLDRIMKIMITRGLDIYEIRKSGNSIIKKCTNPTLKSKLENYYSKGKSAKRVKEEIDEDRNLCEICISNPISCQFGCGHPFCQECAQKVSVCPKCRKPTSQIIPLFIS